MRPVDTQYTLRPGGDNAVPTLREPKGHVESVRVYFDNPLLHVRTRRGVGFHFICECGEIGPRRKQRARAVQDLRAHRQDEHPG